MEHVALSFAIVCAEIGFPKVVYVDNGSEYGCVELLKSQGLARVVQAIPYSARSKAIEPAIRVFMDHHASLMAGYLGNDRMAQNTQSVGAPATTFPGRVDGLSQQLEGSPQAVNN